MKNRRLISLMSAIALVLIPGGNCWAASAAEDAASATKSSSTINKATTAQKHSQSTPQLVPPPPPNVPLHGMLVPVMDPGASAPTSSTPAATTADAAGQDRAMVNRRPLPRHTTAKALVPAPEAEGALNSGDGGGASDSAADMSIPIESLGEDYRLAPGDVLTIIDPSMGTPDAPAETTMSVSPAGLIYLNPYGLIKARDKTVYQLTAHINKLAERYSDSPDVMVELVRQRPINVYVLGDVMSPGLWNSKQKSFAEQETDSINLIGTTQQNNARVGANVSKFAFQSLLGGSNANTNQSTFSVPAKVEKPPSLENLPLTALTAIQLAGGIKDTADIRNIRITRRSDGKVFPMDLQKLLVQGDFSQDRALQNGDVVYVPKGASGFDSSQLGMAANRYKYVRVWGEVRVPGMYILEPQDDLYSVVAKAGGFTPIAKHALQLNRVNRDGTVTTKTIAINPSLNKIDAIAREPVMPGDVIVVRSNMMKKYGPTVVNKTSLAAGAVFLLFLSSALRGTSGALF